MLSPWNRISPAVTSYLGWPMSVFANVLLPEPFGPMSAWISPLRHLEREALEDLLALHGDVEVLDHQFRRLAHVVGFPRRPSEAGLCARRGRRSGGSASGASRWGQAEKLSPQAQLCFTFGLLNLNPAPIRPST